MSLLKALKLQIVFQKLRSWFLLAIRFLFPYSPLSQTSESKGFHSIPGPRSFPVIGSLLSLKKYGGHLDAVYPNLLFELHKQYGKLVRFGIAKKPELYLYDPDSAEKVFKLNDHDPGKKKLEPWIVYFDCLKKAQSLSNSEGARWRKLRNSMNPVLSHPQSVLKFIDNQNIIINEAIGFIRRKINETQDKRSVNFGSFENQIRLLTLELVSDAALGKKIPAVDVSSQETNEFVEVLDQFTLAMSELMGSLPVWKYVSTSEWKKFKNAADRFFKFIGTHVDEALDRAVSSGTENYSVIKHMYENREKYNISIDDINSVVSELFTSGIDTFSSTLHFAFYKLGTDKKLQDEMYAEIKRLIKPGQEVNESVLSDAKYVKAFMKEVLRYYPIVMAVGRLVREDMTLNGYRVPKGTFVNVVSGVTSRLDSVYDNASKFDPHRWLDESKNYHPYGMLPFGSGSRSCVAKIISEQKMHMILIKLIQHFEITYTGEDIGFINSAFSRPDKPLSLKFTTRLSD